MHFRSKSGLSLLACSLMVLSAAAARGQEGQAPAAPAPAAPSEQAAPGAAAAAPVKLPEPDPKNFTADSPTKETVDAFLRQFWGYDPNRIWQVEAVEKTQAPGVSKVVVAVAQKNSQQQAGGLTFFVTPDGKHLIAADDVLPFGEHPFEEARKTLETEANGPSKGAPGKQLLMVEFADYQCPHCKEAEATIEKLLQDFPNAHFVFENYPLVSIHSEAYKAASYSECAAKLGGNDAFFKFSSAVFAAQENLTPATSDQALRDASTKAGLDPIKMAACSTSADAKSALDASIKLAKDLNVNQTPTLYVNGRGLPLGAVPYETLKQIVTFQAGQDAAASK
jgi:protein-disulfide isomerase